MCDGGIGGKMMTVRQRGRRGGPRCTVIAGDVECAEGTGQNIGSVGVGSSPGVSLRAGRGRIARGTRWQDVEMRSNDGSVAAKDAAWHGAGLRGRPGSVVSGRVATPAQPVKARAASSRNAGSAAVETLRGIAAEREKASRDTPKFSACDVELSCRGRLNGNWCDAKMWLF